MTAPEPNFICKICGRLISSFERVLHELNCKNSQNIVLRMIEQKNNIASKTTGNINNIYNNSLSYTCNICGAKIKEKEEHFLHHNIPNNENITRINNFTLINNSTIMNNDNMNNTSKNEEALNIDGIQIAQNIQANDINQQIEEEDQNNEYYYYNQNAQDNDNDLNNSIHENRYSDDIISFDNILINNHNNHADTKIVENLITNEIKDINKFAVKSCSICLENFKNGDNYIILPCIHFFHASCLKNWMKVNNRCPICNFKLIINNILSTKYNNNKI